MRCMWVCETIYTQQRKHTIHGAYLACADSGCSNAASGSAGKNPRSSDTYDCRVSSSSSRVSCLRSPCTGRADTSNDVMYCRLDVTRGGLSPMTVLETTPAAVASWGKQLDANLVCRASGSYLTNA